MTCRNDKSGVGPEWKYNSFKAYFEQSKLATGNANQQWSFLDTCIDDKLAAIVDRELYHKYPMTYSVGNRPSTMGILEKHFDSQIRLNKWCP